MGTADRHARAFVSALLSTTRDRHDDMRALVSGLPDGALVWRPTDESPAIAGLAAHVLDVEGYLISLVTREDIGWTGELGSHIHDEATENELLGAISSTTDRFDSAFASVTDEDLGSMTIEDGSVAAALVEDLDHVATHLGQMQLTRYLFEVAHPDAPRTYEHWG